MPTLLWRVLVFAFVSLAVLLLLGAFAFGARGGVNTYVALLCFFGAACLVATEVQESSPRFALRGGAGATCFWGILFLLVGLFLFLEETLKVREEGGTVILVVTSLALWAVAAWRWGSPVYAGFAGISFFLLLARAPLGRVLWIVGGVGMALVFGRFLDRPAPSPSHRRGAAVLVAVGLVGAYAAVNLYSLDNRLVEKIGSVWLNAPGLRFGERIESIVLTALVPLAIVVWGIRSRRVFALDIGLVLTALSLLTLRFYVHLAATWLLLILAGAGLLLLALGCHRWLARGSGKERNGFTAEPLFADERRLRAFELVPVVAAHTPESAPAAEPGYQGGGGTFGGGGAGGSY